MKAIIYPLFSEDKKNEGRKKIFIFMEMYVSILMMIWVWMRSYFLDDIMIKYSEVGGNFVVNIPFQHNAIKLRI